VFSCHVLCCLLLSCLVVSCRVVSCRALPCLVLSRLFFYVFTFYLFLYFVVLSRLVCFVNVLCVVLFRLVCRWSCYVLSPCYVYIVYTLLPGNTRYFRFSGAGPSLNCSVFSVTARNHAVPSRVVQHPHHMDYGVVITVEAKRKERAACYEIYARLGGTAWTSSRFPADSHSLTTRWCTDGAPLSQWHGILTDGEGYISQIDLSNNNVEGSLEMAIPPLQHLSRLTNLFLSGNPKLTGPLSKRILDLPALSILGQLPRGHDRPHSIQDLCFYFHVVFHC
jgi:hypothetical protein